MKRIYSTLLFVLPALLSNAQITLQASDMPVVNDTVRYSTSAVDLSALYTQAGANQMWDASALVPNFQDIAKYKTPSSISLLYLTSFSTSTYGTISTSGLNLGAVQGTDVYDFFKNSVGAFVQDGRGFSIQGLPLSQTWKDTVLRFPVNYGNVDSSRFLSNEVNALIATLTHVGKRVNTVDGWGSLVTPYGTFNCLRVKSVLRTVDTLKTSLIPIPIPIPQSTIEYKWYAKGKKIPVLEIDVPQGTGGGTATIRYRDTVRPQAFINQANFSANKTTFSLSNATDTCIISDNSTHTAVSRTWTITPNTYTFTGGTGTGDQQTKLFFTAPGVYTVKLQVNYNAGSDDTIRVNYITVTGNVNSIKAGFIVSNTTTPTNQSLHFTDTSKGSPTSWTWSFDPTTVTYVNGTSATSANPDVQFTVPGFYAVTLNVSNGQGSDAVTKQNCVLAMTPSGIQETISQHGYVIYPNPAYDQIMVKGEIKNLSLFSVTGQQLVQSESSSIHIGDLPNGLYLLMVTAVDGNTVTYKVQVQH